MQRMLILFTAFLNIFLAVDSFADQKIFTLNDDEVSAVSQKQELTYGTLPMPDLHQTYIKYSDGTANFFMAGKRMMRRYLTSDFARFQPVNIGTCFFGPSNIGSAEFDADYAAPSAVFNSPQNPAQLLMLYHGENHYGRKKGQGPTYATIGLAISNNGGKNWIRQGAIISGREAQPSSPPKNKFNMGAGNPSAIVARDGYIYVFFNDNVSADGLFRGQNNLCLARAPITSDGSPGSWKKFYHGEFNEDGFGGMCDQIVQNPPASSGVSYAINPDISFNAALNAYLLIFNSDDGFFYATSNDLLKWSRPVLLMRTPPRLDSLKTAGANYYEHPTLISPSAASEQLTGESGFLFYAKGAQDNNLSKSEHSWFRRSFRIVKVK